MSVKICDSIMGSGKSCAAIRYMNEQEKRFIYLTPYLDEVQRIKDSCCEKKFMSPENKGVGKLDNLHQLLGNKQNIASTHALFSYYNESTTELIREGEYTLILDEVFGVLEPVKINKADIKVLFDSNLIKIDDDGEHIKWVDDEYDGTKFADIKGKAQTHNLIYYKGLMMFWTFPIDIFKSFQDVFVLTYMFDAQIQKYYYDMNKIPIEKIGIEKDAYGYKFGEVPYLPESVCTLKDKIHILDHDKLNSIGGNEFALSSSWYQRNKALRDKPLIQKLKNNLNNYYRNITDSKADKRMWTTFKEYVPLLKGKGYSKYFVSCNARATNEFIDRNILAYCVNIYFNPILKNYFIDHKVEVKEDEYALSELLQWIWRSAIRRDNEIWLYIPSMRMRRLLNEWLDSLRNMKNN